MSWVLIPSTNKRGESGAQISCVKTYKLSCQQIPWGRDRQSILFIIIFLILGGYNFASFKDMLLKLIQATIIDSKNMLGWAFLWLPVTWLSNGQLKKIQTPKSFSFMSM